ncbi:MAG: hypothetical protein JXX28_12885, partial [Deltaproteobacteria bacterium]|nr:hypothetical protein [Deltaproteobacteria bacterium]
PEGYVQSDTDCDDSSALFHPGAAEADCTDPADYNCDGSVGYADADGDGFAACEECDDARDDVNPEADEVCDEVDNDCDGDVDDSPVDAATWYLDADGDSYGAAAISLAACEAPAGYVADATDCDDLEATVFPGAEERCDGLANACGALPEDEADADRDGFMVCAGDCDDAAASAHPGGTEVCDGRDNDCDGDADVGAVDAPTWYTDTDGDGYGVDVGAVTACSAPQGAVALAGDCDDSTAEASPAGTERCGDGLDNDCDGDVDDASAVDAASWHLDADGDGHGRPGAGVPACEAPDGYVASLDDCDDLDATVFPGAVELCDGLANTCGALPADEADADRDGFLACADDCDDALAGVHPGANEHCDGVDEDCDGLVDDAAVDQTVWHLDGDGDGYGHLHITRTQCEAPADFVADGTDCDDEDATTNPGEREVPGNGKDDTCDGEDRPLLIYAVERDAGILVALDYYSGEEVWRLGELGPMIDVAVAPDGSLYASAVTSGLLHIAADGSSYEEVATGYTYAAGVWYDLFTDTVLFSDIDGTIAEYDPATDTTVQLATGLGDGPLHTLRRGGDDTLITSFNGAQRVATLDPASGTWSELGALSPGGGYTMVPTGDGGLWVGGGGGIDHLDATGRLDGRWEGAHAPLGLCPDPLDPAALLSPTYGPAVALLDPSRPGSVLLAEGYTKLWGCATNGLRDLDGDGYVGAAYGGLDCDDTDPAVLPGAVDPWGDGLDADCDLVDGVDGDGDGVVGTHPLPGCQDADDTDPTVGATDCPLRSCADWLAADSTLPDGIYRVDPDGDGDARDGVDVWCDMTHDGGGWTVVTAWNYDEDGFSERSLMEGDPGYMHTGAMCQPELSRSFSCVKPLNDAGFTDVIADGEILFFIEHDDAGDEDPWMSTAIAGLADLKLFMSHGHSAAEKCTDGTCAAMAAAFADDSSTRANRWHRSGPAHFETSAAYFNGSIAIGHMWNENGSGRCNSDVDRLHWGWDTRAGIAYYRNSYTDNCYYDTTESKKRFAYVAFR